MYYLPLRLTIQSLYEPLLLPQETSMKWEIRATDEWEEAEELAAKGWELVSVVYIPSNLTEIMYYFKRLI